MVVEKKAILREKRISDAANDYNWRCDPELTRYDGVMPLTMSREEFTLYYAWDLQSGGRLRHWYAIDTLGGKHIGNCMYYNVEDDGEQAMLGIMIGDREYWGKGYGTDAVDTLVSYIFQRTSVDKICLDTLEWNIRAQRCFQKCGFVTCGRVSKRGHDFLVMELRRSWLKPVEDNSEQC